MTINERFERLCDSITIERLSGLVPFGLMLLNHFRKPAQTLEVQTINKESDMEKEVVIGTEGKVELKLANGKLYLIGNYDGKQVDAVLSVGIEVDLFIDQLKAQIPGVIDDAILDVLKAALKVI